MIIKLMSPSDTPDVPDDHSSRKYRIIDDVQEVYSTHLETKEHAIQVQYRVPVRGLMSETFVVNDNIYVMNDSGKTIQTVYPNSDLITKSSNPYL